MKRIAFVNQRYGKEVNGGSEYYTMLMAGKLKEYYNVEVLTSKALTYDKWEDYYTEDVETIDGISVRRFGVRKKRSRILQRILKILITSLGANTQKVTGLWNKILGPYVPDLVEYIRNHKHEYDAFIFVTYMYYPTVFGMKDVADKAIFVPTAHDEYNIYFKIYESIFRMPKTIVYLTEEERDFVQELFHNEEVGHEVIGVGIDVPEQTDEHSFRQKYNINGDYILYAGRVDVDKGCITMFEYFSRYSMEHRELQLVVIGKSYMEIPKTDNIRYLGFVSEEDKYNAMKGARLLWLPSRFESLSIAVLEAMALGTPVIVNGECEVLRGHCIRSGGGKSYRDYNDIQNILNEMNGQKYQLYVEKARLYVFKYYNWDNVIKDWKSVIQKAVYTNGKE